jgi:selenocysteine-specific elongation factor
MNGVSTAELRVCATAGHVDHGKSSLIIRLTGIDPDRWAEEKRRGLTIDLGYAWTTLPSGREIGFVDVPGHERFIRNMLAGVGPVRLVLFVVAADEGWRRQSEEHLQILDVLGLSGGVIALSKRDLVDDQTLEIARQEVAERVEGTALADAPIVPVSSRTGDGVAELVEALDAMFATAPPPPRARTRLFVDRVFSIRGAGTVVTGTLTGDCLRSGDDVELYPTGARARIRSLQTHKRAEERACPVARVAANLVGAERDELERGDVLGHPGAWRSSSSFDVLVRPVRDLAAALTSKGAFKVYAGAAEVDARLRFLEPASLEPGGQAFARISTSRPLVLDVFDRFVLREAGRRQTVAGGLVLDPAPGPRAGPDRVSALVGRAAAQRERLPSLLLAERGAVPVAEAEMLTGSDVPGGDVVGAWVIDPSVRERIASDLMAWLAAFHDAHPLEEGAAIGDARQAFARALVACRAPKDESLIDALLNDLDRRGVIARSATTIRLATHHVDLGARKEDVDRLLTALSGEREATPPTVKELLDDGYGRDVIDAAARAGLVVRLSPDLVVAPSLVERAVEIVRAAGPGGITLSMLRESLRTSRKYAVPLAEHLDRTGFTRREGDLRFPRS